MVVLPARRCGLVILTNRAPHPLLDIVGMAVLDRLCGRSWFLLARPLPRPPGGVPGPPRDRPRGPRRRPQARRRPDPPARRVLATTPIPATARSRSRPRARRCTGASAASPARSPTATTTSLRCRRTRRCCRPTTCLITFAYDREGNIDRLSAPLDAGPRHRVPPRGVGRGDRPRFPRRLRRQLPERPDAARRRARRRRPADAVADRTADLSARAVSGGRMFALAGLEGFRVEFQREAAERSARWCSISRMGRIKGSGLRSEARRVCGPDKTFAG